jgi:hypothetical protein
MEFDASRLRRGELIAGASAVLLFVFMFLPWYGLKVATARRSITLPGSYDAWNAFDVIDWFLLVTIIVAVSLPFFQATRRAPAIPVSISVVSTVLGIIAGLLIVFRLLDRPHLVNVPDVLTPLAVHLDRTLKAGAFLGLLGALGIAAGSYLSLRQEGVAEKDGPQDIETVSAVRMGGS